MKWFCVCFLAACLASQADAQHGFGGGTPSLPTTDERGYPRFDERLTDVPGHGLGGYGLLGGATPEQYRDLVAPSEGQANGWQTPWEMASSFTPKEWAFLAAMFALTVVGAYQQHRRRAR